MSETADVAELQFLATEVPYLSLGSSLGAIEGQRVLVIGNPRGLEGTVSEGIISAFRENRSYIQITAPISPGSSGSPLLDETGKVIGMATLVYKEGENLNFAISAEVIREVIAKSAAVTSSPTPFRALPPSPSSTPADTNQLVNAYFNRAVEEDAKGEFQTAIAGDACEDQGIASGRSSSLICFH
jgi:serine protease Do